MQKYGIEGSSLLAEEDAAPSVSKRTENRAHVPRHRQDMNFFSSFCRRAELCSPVLGMEAFHSASDGMKTYQDVQNVVSRKVFFCQKKPAGGSFLVS